MKEYIIDILKYKLDSYQGSSRHTSDLAFLLLEEANINGSFTCSRYEAKEWIKEYFDDIEEFIEDLMELDGLMGYQNIITANPFTESEKFQVQIIIEFSINLLSKCKTIDKNWDKEITLTKSIINKIKKELDELEE